MSTPILKTLVNEKRNYKLLIKGGLHFIKGNKKPYFSLTADYILNGRHESGGCNHELIMKHAPEFKDLIDLHLSDIDGVPMHALENGWYWMGRTKWEKGNVKNLAEHFRVSEAIAEDMINDPTITKESLGREIEEYYKPRWKAEAEAAIKKFKLEVFGDEYK
jgi:hypothetical protein